jgi:hypothetical protein
MTRAWFETLTKKQAGSEEEVNLLYQRLFKQ